MKSRTTRMPRTLVIVGLALLVAMTFVATRLEALPSDELITDYFSDEGFTNHVGTSILFCIGRWRLIWGTTAAFYVESRWSCSTGEPGSTVCYENGIQIVCPPHICNEYGFCT